MKFCCQGDKILFTKKKPPHNQPIIQVWHHLTKSPQELRKNFFIILILFGSNLSLDEDLKI